MLIFEQKTLITMASQTIFLHLNTGHPTPLNRPFISGSIIYFLSNSYNGVPDSKVSHDNSSVNLINGDDVLLHISIRRKENRIIFNTYRNGAWDQNYQQIGLQSVLSGPGATIKVAATNDAYHISFDENPRNRGNVHTYKKRINANATAVDYWANAGQTRVFSNPLIVQVYDPARRGVFISSFF